jgi:hypothetical protein
MGNENIEWRTVLRIQLSHFTVFHHISAIIPHGVDSFKEFPHCHDPVIFPPVSELNNPLGFFCGF